MNTSNPKIGAADRMKCATATIAVLRTLELLDTTMTYGQFARAIGLRGMEEEWQAWHRKISRQPWKIRPKWTSRRSSTTE